MKKATFAELIRDIEAEARAECPEAVAQHEVMRQRYYLGGQVGHAAEAPEADPARARKTLRH